MFKYVHPVKRIPKLLLYGDSISIAYTLAVREYMRGKTTVFLLFRNGSSSQAFIPAMRWLYSLENDEGARNAHNVGKWDSCYEFD